MRKTLTELLLDRNPVEVADAIVGASREDREEGIEKNATIDDALSTLGIEADLGGSESGLDPEHLEKVASAVERVVGALSFVRPDVELEDILSVEGKRLLEGREIPQLEDSPFEKQASRRITPALKERIRAHLGRRQS